MRLKRLTLHGFKSFGALTELTFVPGLTAIVGPNGCGKSNLADAIRWALGEQSLRLLRGRRTEDVIFAGGARRPPAGFAEVSLTFDNADGKLPLPVAEVAITRRAYPTGENEYFLNGERVRLRDVHRLLGRAGLGTGSHVVIGQGLVDVALSLRPEERRGLFEDAATISHLSIQIHETRQKLAETDQNLRRVCDLLVELEPRAATLARQASQARERARIAAELEDLLSAQFARRWRDSLAERDRAVQRLAAATITVQRFAEMAEQAGRQLAAARDARAEVQARLLALRAESEPLRQRGAQAAALVDRHRRHHVELLTTANRLAVERQDLERRLAELQQLIAHNAAERRQAGERVAALGAELAKVEAYSEEALRRRRELERMRQQAQREESEAEQALIAARERQRIREQRLAQLDQQIEMLVARQEATQRQLDEAIARQRDAETALQEIQRATAARAQRREEIARRLSERRGELERLLSAEDKLDREIALSRERLALLEGERGYDGLFPGVRAVLRASKMPPHDPNAPMLSGIIGTVSSLIEVPPQLETAIEIALGGRLQDIVVERWSDAEAAVAFLRRTNAGRATFLPLDSLRVGSGTPGNSSWLRAPGVLGIAADLVTTSERFNVIRRHLLGTTLIVEDLPTARRVLSACPSGWQIVTVAGDVVRSSGAITGGAVPSRAGGRPGTLARERERRQLPVDIAAKEAHRRGVQAEVETARERIKVLSADLAAIEREEQGAAAHARNVERQLAGAQRESGRLEEEARLQSEQLARLRHERTQLDAEDARSREELGRVLADARKRVAEAEEALSQLEASEGDTLRRLGELRAEAAHANRDVARLDREAQQLQDERRRLEGELTRARDREAEQARQLDAACRAVEAATEVLESLRQQAEQLVEHQRRLEETLTAREQEQLYAEQTERAARERLNRAESEEKLATQALQQVETQIENLKRQIAIELGPVEEADGELVVTLADGPRRLGGAEDASTQPASERSSQRRIDHLRQQLRRLPAVGPEVIEEHRAIEARCAFLRTQLGDLQSAADDLRRAIVELEATVRTRFHESFTAVAEAFERRFVKLFGGGSAQLVLVEGDSPDQIGVEIIAQPPGKRARGLALLSGGERALTAVSLLLALLEVNPTPFCVLDEVDAALDDANVGRFCEALAELGERTQFIAITHNRRTMEAAQTLYGVTMEDRTLSRVVSLRLTDALSSNGRLAGDGHQNTSAMGQGADSTG